MSNWTRKEKHCDTIISKVKGFKFMGPNDDKLMINQLTLTNEHDHIWNEILYKISNFISIYVKIIQNVIFRNICVTSVILKFIWKKYKRVRCLAVIKSLIQKNNSASCASCAVNQFIRIWKEEEESKLWLKNPLIS